ncbi:hypothetical protein N7489_003987 [Penicillium chrysogenum]|uniref:uncharacterized protein n=1 Tax=Penicillium chrysogenum TaxID=5076 RepID=UPI0024DF185B|nr:uncharacterized protein N7489_003987 [Penicillium chrysogenum]KAJ5243891.1 hypothetical protein N7489_003987 [Penicillium chrysogenum]KAJ6157220.1 hypothetical protein N7497_006105 [Penicillium chrysogenum]
MFITPYLLSGKDRDTLLQSLSFALNRLLGQSWDSVANNNGELIIFNNIDRYHPFDSSISNRYDITEFFPKADHSSILITSRLQGLTKLGEPFLLLLSPGRLYMKLELVSLSTYSTIKNLSLSYSYNRILDKRNLSVVDLLLLLTRFNNRDI